MSGVKDSRSVCTRAAHGRCEGNARKSLTARGDSPLESVRDRQGAVAVRAADRSGSGARESPAAVTAGRKQAKVGEKDQVDDRRESGSGFDQGLQLGEDLGVAEAGRAAGLDELLNILAIGKPRQCHNVDTGGRIECGQDGGDLRRVAHAVGVRVADDRGGTAGQLRPVGEPGAFAPWRWWWREAGPATRRCRRISRLRGWRR